MATATTTTAEGTLSRETLKGRSADKPSLASSAQLLALHRHLTKSLLKPVCPDIRLKAFDRIYSLHRIFLVQATFFNALLDGDFQEAKAKKGVWKRQEARSSSSSSKDIDDEDNAVELHFDDANITRPAFEYCIATLYGAAPTLILPSWCCPSPEHPLTTHFNIDQSSQSVKSPTFSSTSTNEGYSNAQHPATPRFLLSLIASATYLGIPSVASQAVTLIMCSITPYTISQYLRFSLGHGILGAQEAQDRQQDCSHSHWDWELEGPLWGLESLSEECSQDRSSISSVLEQTEALSVQDDDDDEQIKAGSDQSQFSSSPSVRRGKAGSGDSFLPCLISDREEILSHQGRYYYGAQSDKIGEVCSCWLLRWGADVLLTEEHMQFDEDGQDLSPYVSAFTLPKNVLPIAQSFTSSDDHHSNIAQALTAPQATVWSHPKVGGIPASWARNIISSDSFWIRSEWDRYDVAKRVVAMRRGYRDNFVEADESVGEGEEEEGDNEYINSVEWEEMKSSKRASTPTQNKESSVGSQDDEDEKQYSLLFSEGIYYTHMTFEELSAISNQICPRSGSTYVPMTVLQSALWAQSELKNTVLTKEKPPPRAVNLEEEVEDISSSSNSTKKPEDPKAFPERRLDLVSSEEDFAAAFQNIQKKGRKSGDISIQSNSIVLGGMRPLMLLGASSKAKALENLLDKRFFAVPSDDTVRIGENLSSLVNTSSSDANAAPFAEEENGGPSGLAAVIDNYTLNIAHDSKRATVKEYFGVQNAVMSGRGLGINYGKGSTTTTVKKWTGYEPMRLGAEFYGVDRLKERERMYSPSFFYAGSIWNLYLQVVKKPKGLQVGIYLHRQNCNDSLPSPSFPSDLISDTSNIRGRPRTPRRREANNGNGLTGSMFYTSSSPVTTNASPLDTLSTPVQASTFSRTASSAAIPGSNTRLRSTLSTPIQNSISLTPSPTSNCIINSNQNPQYLDERPILRAYFSVHCPSPLGTSLTKFSSQPDDFALNQSWGWKSSSLLGAVYLADNKTGTAESQVSSIFRCIVTVGVV